MEVLTIIAYYQPTTRAYVDQIRGVDSSYTVGLLLDRHLIEECGRLQVPGRPRLYRTTQAFLRAFQSRMKALKPRVAFQVDNTLTGEGKLNVDLTFDSMDDFLPDAVARKVEPLNKLLEARTQLSNLLTYMDGKHGAEELIAKILQDPTLLKSLSQLPKNDESAKGSEE